MSGWADAGRQAMMVINIATNEEAIFRIGHLKT
jgi:hypothetical protein